MRTSPLKRRIDGSQLVTTLDRAQPASHLLSRTLPLESWLEGPWLPLILLVVAFLVVRPWVDAPLNDDWQYARAAKLLAETGTLTIETQIAPSIVVQSYLGAFAIKLFGFSHVTLRLLTLLLASVGLVCIERTLRYVRVPSVWILAALALVVVHPISLHSTITFMSEWYGAVFALIAVAIWFRVRARLGDDDRLPLWLYLVTATLSVAAFWSRQTDILVYPALVASRWRFVFRAASRARMLELASATAGAVFVAAGVFGYFTWLHATGNYKAAFDRPLSTLTTLSPKLWLIQFSCCLAYMSASFAPILLLARSQRADSLHWRVGAACAAFMLAGLLAIQIEGGREFVANRWLNARFPYVSNLVYPTGVGPVTFTEIGYYGGRSRPNWSYETLWRYIEYGVLLSTVLWGVLVRNPRAARELTDRKESRVELCWFAAAWLSSGLILTVQAHQHEVFDRYYFPFILALALLVPALLTSSHDRTSPRSWPRLLMAGGAFLAIAWFSIAGTHDYLRWQSARAKLYQRAIALGASPSSIDGGYELNGWNNINANHPIACIGECSCKPKTWYCHDNSYRIVMGDLPPGYRELLRRTPRYWLANAPPVMLVAREESTAIVAADR